MLTYLSAVLSGEAEPFWPHFVLLSVSIVAAFAVGFGILLESPKYSAAIHKAATWLVLGGIAIESACTVLLFVFDEGVSSALQSTISSQQLKILDLDTKTSAAELVAENASKNASSATARAAELGIKAASLNKEAADLRAATSARPWTQDQFDAIQDIKGVVMDVGILWASHCVECQEFGTFIEMALHSAGAQIYGAHASEQMAASNTGIFVRLPVGSDLQNHPLVVALRKAGLNPVSTHHIPEFSKIRADIPVIFVGERFPTILSMPYQPAGQSAWTMLPLEKP